MNIIFISYKYILGRPLSALLSILLLSFGVAIILIILLTHHLLKSEIERNAQGIDLVVGAKGSPLQIILSSIYHIDFPTGNISLLDANQLANHRLIAGAIPLSLGDSHEGFRVVGTTTGYADLYAAELQAGSSWFDKEMTATIGFGVAERLHLKLGDTFATTHGMVKEGNRHDQDIFTIKGIMKPSGTVLDNLILVPLSSIWKVHDHSDETDTVIKKSSVHDFVRLEKLGIEISKEKLKQAQITAILVRYLSPIAVIQLPRLVNQISNLQAAAPAYEIARLLHMFGNGMEIANGLGIIIMILSAISVLGALINSLKERKYQLAIMRVMGASRFKVFFLIFVEGMMLTIVGIALGFALSHAGLAILQTKVGSIQNSYFFFVYEEVYVMLVGLGIGVVSSIFPAGLAMRTHISKTLAKF